MVQDIDDSENSLRRWQASDYQRILKVHHS